jgi:MYXO-CTERM domain-containing protein
MTARCAVLAALLVAGPAAAWQRSTIPDTGACLFWPSRAVAFGLSPEGAPGLPITAVSAAVGAALRTWSRPACTDLSLSLSGATQNEIVWRTQRCEGATTTNCWAFGNDVIAAPTTTLDRTTGAIQRAMIELNASGNPPFLFETCQAGQLCDGYDLQTVVTHEIGRAIGIDDSKVEGAVMYPYLPMGAMIRSLATDDLDAVCGIYPRGAPTPSCGVLPPPVPVPVPAPAPPETRHGCSSAPEAAPALALAALALLRRRRAT